jgi:Tfp pilus assembly protein PilV
MHTSIATSRPHRERGSMLIELLFATTILTIGFGGILVLLTGSMYSNSRSSNDTTSTMLAEHILEQISSTPANSNTALTITDCAGTNWSISVAGAAVNGGNGGSYGGNGASLTSAAIVDWTQTYSNIPAGYAMQYVACGSGGKQITYDIRWDVVNMSTYTRMVMISARPVGSAYVGGLRYVVPVNLRTIAGM